MFYPDYTELPGIESPEGKEIEFVKPDYSRESTGILILYYDRIELHYMLEAEHPHASHLLFQNRNQGATMVSKYRYNRYFLTSDLLLPMMIEIRDYFKNKTYEQAREVTNATFKAGRRPSQD